MGMENFKQIIEGNKYIDVPVGACVGSSEGQKEGNLLGNCVGIKLG